MQMFISGRLSRCGSEAHVVIGAPRPVAGCARGDKVCQVEIRRAGTAVRLHPQPGSIRAALENAHHGLLLFFGLMVKTQGG
ncbi:hypothetical protein [Nocardia tengchongensis]|uniref:hypothetical protein n=1 Tax=Nocardia tengchongensis TaxID=2055889 RepID=UPI00368B639A